MQFDHLGESFVGEAPGWGEGTALPAHRCHCPDFPMSWVLRGLQNPLSAASRAPLSPWAQEPGELPATDQPLLGAQRPACPGRAFRLEAEATWWAVESDMLQPLLLSHQSKYLPEPQLPSLRRENNNTAVTGLREK